MALVPYLDADQVPEEYRHLLDRPINLFHALSNSPEALSQFHPFGEWIRWDCTLDPRLRELLILQVGYLTQDAYEWSHHVVLSRQFGVTEEDIEGLIAFTAGEPTTLAELDRIVLQAATELTRDRRLADETVGLLKAHYDDGQLTDIVIVASFYNMVVRVLGGLRIEVEPGTEFSDALDRFPVGPAAANGRHSA